MEKAGLPIIIGNSSSFCIITDGNDTWEPTLDDISYGGYQYEKLCRISGNIDIGTAPFSLIIGFDGSLILPCTSDYFSIESASIHYNKFLGSLLLGGIFFKAIDPSNISLGEINTLGYFRISRPGNGDASTFHQAIQQQFLFGPTAIQLLTPTKIRFDDLARAYYSGKNLSKKIENASLDLFITGVSHYTENRNIEALICLWTFVEQLIDLIWSKSILANAGDIPGRKKFLEDSRTWTVSAKIEVIFLKSLFEESLYKSINDIRKARNAYIHKGENPTSETVSKLIEVGMQIISLISSDYSDKDIFLDVTTTIPAPKTICEKIEDNPITEFQYWIPMKPIPGDIKWGDKPFEDNSKYHLVTDYGEKMR